MVEDIEQPRQGLELSFPHDEAPLRLGSERPDYGMHPARLVHEGAVVRGLTILWEVQAPREHEDERPEVEVLAGPLSVG